MFSTRGLQFQLTVYSTACLYVSAITETTTTTKTNYMYLPSKMLHHKLTISVSMSIEIVLPSQICRNG